MLTSSYISWTDETKLEPCDVLTSAEDLTNVTMSFCKSALTHSLKLGFTKSKYVSELKPKDVMLVVFYFECGPVGWDRKTNTKIAFFKLD